MKNTPLKFAYISILNLILSTSLSAKYISVKDFCVPGTIETVETNQDTGEEVWKTGDYKALFSNKTAIDQNFDQYAIQLNQGNTGTCYAHAAVQLFLYQLSKDKHLDSIAKNVYLDFWQGKKAGLINEVASYLLASLKSSQRFQNGGHSFIFLYDLLSQKGDFKYSKLFDIINCLSEDPYNLKGDTLRQCVRLLEKNVEKLKKCTESSGQQNASYAELENSFQDLMDVSGRYLIEDKAKPNYCVEVNHLDKNSNIDQAVERIIRPKINQGRPVMISVSANSSYLDTNAGSKIQVSDHELIVTGLVKTQCLVRNGSDLNPVSFWSVKVKNSYGGNMNDWYLLNNPIDSAGGLLPDSSAITSLTECSKEMRSIGRFASFPNLRKEMAENKGVHFLNPVIGSGNSQLLNELIYDVHFDPNAQVYSSYSDAGEKTIGLTPLYLAILRDDAEAAYILAQRPDTDPNLNSFFKDKPFFTNPLETAVLLNRQKITKILLTNFKTNPYLLSPIAASYLVAQSSQDIELANLYLQRQYQFNTSTVTSAVSSLFSAAHSSIQGVMQTTGRQASSFVEKTVRELESFAEKIMP